MSDARRTRIFNADVGDYSEGVAGPDAIEQDFDNIYANAAFKQDILSKGNEEPFVPSKDYDPCTKQYVDNTLGDIASVLDFVNGEEV